MHNSERKTIHHEKERRMIEEAKTTSPEQNAINLSSKVSSPAEKSLYTKKGPSFVPTPTDISWCNLQQDFDSFVNELLFHAFLKKKIIDKLIQPVETFQLGNPPVKVEALSVETFQLGNPPVKA